MRIVQIVPTLPPQISGIGDYANLLADELKDKGIETLLLYKRAKGVEFSEELNSASIYLGHQTSTSLANALERVNAKKVLLHFSGYGYAHWGLCFWLLNGLKKWRANEPRGRLITIFHELFARGPFWRASGWTSSLQRNIARDLVFTSDGSIVTSQPALDQIHRWKPDLQATLLPVFSNVGELSAPPALETRDPFAVVFGQAERRALVYSSLLRKSNIVASGFTRMGVERILDIGPPIDAPGECGGRKIEICGTLEADSISDTLRCTRVGLINYPYSVLTKSGIAAAYFAHGLLCVNSARTQNDLNGFQGGKEFLYLNELSDSSIDASAVAAAGHTWYNQHNRASSAEKIAQLFQLCSD